MSTLVGGKECRWYDARELVEPEEGEIKQRGFKPDPLSDLLHVISQQAYHQRPENSRYSRLSAEPALPKWKFKPVHQLDASMQMPIFPRKQLEATTTTPNCKIDTNYSLVRNSKSAETILRLQHMLINLKERVGSLDERLNDHIGTVDCNNEAASLKQKLCNNHDINNNNNNESGANNTNDTDNDQASPAARFWRLTIGSLSARLFWCAWPILLLTLMNRYWPLAVARAKNG